VQIFLGKIIGGRCGGDGSSGSDESSGSSGSGGGGGSDEGGGSDGSSGRYNKKLWQSVGMQKRF